MVNLSRVTEDTFNPLTIPIKVLKLFMSRNNCAMRMNFSIILARSDLESNHKIKLGTKNASLFKRLSKPHTCGDRCRSLSEFHAVCNNSCT